MFNKIKNKIKDQSGLTLIELLAVIVILGIVAAIAVPSIMGIINKSKDDAKVAEAIQIISAAKMKHATNSTVTTWDETTLVGTLENVQDLDGFDVTYDTTNKRYYIDGHDVESVITGTVQTGVVTEKELLDYSK